MSTTRPLITAVDLEQMVDDGHRYDLLRGELIQMPLVSLEHAKIISNFFRVFGSFVDENQLGEVYAPETGFLLETNPDTVLAPDLSFVRRERIPEIANIEGFIPLAPDLIVEVFSYRDLGNRLDERVQVWLDAGTKVVVVIDSTHSRAKVYRPSPNMESYTEWLTSLDRRRGFPADDSADLRYRAASQSLELPDIVPGWSVPLSRIFA